MRSVADQIRSPEMSRSRPVYGRWLGRALSVRSIDVATVQRTARTIIYQ
jgi:hypothetical protein